MPPATSAGGWSRAYWRAGYRVRCLVRDPVRLQGRPWHNEVEIVTGDVLQPDSLAPAMEGVQAAYYLIHSLGGGSDFHQQRFDRRAPLQRCRP